jgi:hypothetical protein
MAQEQLQSRHGLPNSSSALGGSDAGLSQNRAVQNRYSYLFYQSLGHSVRSFQYPTWEYLKFLSLHLSNMFSALLHLFVIQQQQTTTKPFSPKQVGVG